MVDPTTANLQLAQPTRGSDTGTWDVPVNGNMTILDGVGGAITTIPLNNSNVVLSSAQFIAKQIVFNSTLTGSVIITFPTSFIKSYEIFNTCTGSSAFTVTLQSASSGQVVCAPPGETIDVYNDATNMKFKNLGRIGSYWDDCGSSVPNWVSGCTVPPYLNCDGTTFSSATYPILAMKLGGNTLPYSLGRYRLTANQTSTTPISTASGGSFTASSAGITGGIQATTLSSRHLPQLIDPGHTHGISPGAPNNQWITIQLTAGAVNLVGTGNASIQSNNTGITYGSSSQITVPSLPPSYVGGITMIRAG